MKPAIVLLRQSSGRHGDQERKKLPYSVSTNTICRP